LNFDYTVRLTPVALKYVTRLDKLQRLILSGDIFSYYEPIPREVEKVRHLELTFTRSHPINEREMYRISKLTNLQSLVCYNCYSLSNVGIQLLSSLTNLLELAMWDNHSTTSGNFTVLSLLTNLQKLDLSGTRNFEENDLWSLSALTRLTSLSLRGCPLDTFSIRLISHLTTLEELDLSNNVHINENTLSHYITCFVRLRKLEVTNCGFNSRKYHELFLTLLKELTSLRVLK
jgi:hypothetical protein